MSKLFTVRTKYVELAVFAFFFFFFDAINLKIKREKKNKRDLVRLSQTE